MQPSKTLIILSVLVAVLALIAAGIGLFYLEGPGPRDFTTIYGHTIELYGRGLYSNDSSFKAPVLRGTDAVILLFCMPLLIVSILLYRRGSLRGTFLLTGTLSCFLYVAASNAFGAAYNNLYLLYLTYFSASLYAFILSFSSVDFQSLPRQISSDLPVRGIAIFMFIAGLSPCVWLMDIISALSQGGVPENLASYTTDVTTLLDVGIITPASFLAGFMLLRRKPVGYLLSSTLLILLALVGLVVVGQTVMQTLAGIVLTTAQYAAFVVPFVSLSLISMGLMGVILRNISD